MGRCEIPGTSRDGGLVQVDGGTVFDGDGGCVDQYGGTLQCLGGEPWCCLPDGGVTCCSGQM
jgi:hypothetical protein